MNEGYIKFQCDWAKKEIQIPAEVFENLEKCRSELHGLGLIGMYPNGTGFGNISVKNSLGSFYITGSSTGKYSSLETKHYAEVLSYNFAENWLSCVGVTKASAESLTHAAVYEAIPEVRAVVHVHCLWLWKKLLNICPTTSAAIEYGTPEMAIAVRELATETATQECKIIVMGGHEEGILAFGRNLEEATTEIIKIYNRYQND